MGTHLGTATRRLTSSTRGLGAKSHLYSFGVLPNLRTNSFLRVATLLKPHGFATTESADRAHAAAFWLLPLAFSAPMRLVSDGTQRQSALQKFEDGAASDVHFAALSDLNGEFATVI